MLRSIPSTNSVYIQEIARMSFSDPSVPYMPFPNGLDTMGFWPEFPITNELPETSAPFDHPPPFKRPKSSDDNQPVNHRAPQTNLPVNQPIGKIFFKTRLCAKFRMGQCRNGENCNFAHGEEDLRKPPHNWQELVAGRTEDRGNGNWEDDDRIIHRMKLCKKFYNGEECPYGERCNFLHKEPYKNRDRDNSTRFRENSRESSAISIGTTGPPVVPASAPEAYDVNDMANAGVDASRVNGRPVYWKTKLCTKFEITGHCPFGDKCLFAHGQAELVLPGGSRPGEGEPANLSFAPLKPAPLLANEPVPIKNDRGVPLSQEGQRKNCLLKWKGTKKINRIYGDWIDDLPLNLPNEVES